MKPATRVIAAGVALILVAASCAGTTGEAPAAPAAQTTAQPAAPAKPKLLTLVVDTVRGQAGLTDEEKKLDVGTALHCVVMSRYPQGSRIVWRVKVTDVLPFTSSAPALDNTALEYVRLTLPDGKTQDLKYGPHGGTQENPADFFWSTGFTVPADYPTGVFNHKIEAKTLAGVIGTYGFDFFKVSWAQLQVIPGTPGTRRF